jgi:hypothetical protein
MFTQTFVGAGGCGPVPVGLRTTNLTEEVLPPGSSTPDSYVTGHTSSPTGSGGGCGGANRKWTFGGKPDRTRKRG